MVQFEVSQHWIVVPSLYMPPIGLVAFELRLGPVGLLVASLGFPSIGLLALSSRLGPMGSLVFSLRLTPNGLLGVGLRSMSKGGGWSYGWGLGG